LPIGSLQACVGFALDEADKRRDRNSRSTVLSGFDRAANLLRALSRGGRELDPVLDAS